MTSPKPLLVLFGANALSLRVAADARQHADFRCVVLTNALQAASLNPLQTAGIEIITAEKAEDLPIAAVVGDPAQALLISIGAPWIFKKKFLENQLQNRLLNLHGTRLPRERGGTLFSWQIMSGQRTGMCLLHQMTAAIDAGPVLDYAEFIYPAACRKPIDFIACYEEKNNAFLQQYLQKWQAGQPMVPIAAQPEYLSTYWPRLRADVHGWIDWQWQALDIERFICAFDAPYGGARCRWGQQTVLIRDTWAQSGDGHTHPFQHGLVYRNNGQWLSVAANGGELLICSVTDEQGTNLLPRIKPGDRLHTPGADLLGTKRRVVKTAAGLTLQS